MRKREKVPSIRRCWKHGPYVVHLARDAIGALVAHHPSIKCVILNACNSVASLSKPVADITIGMDSSVDDDAAIQFAQGFYDAIAAGKPYDFAINEGKIACQTKGLTIPVKVLKR